MRNRPRKDEAGGVSLLLAAALLAIVGATALVVDGGYLMARQRSLQAIADAAALAGAASLSGPAGSAEVDARANAAANGFSGSAVTVQTPYGADPTKLAVTITATSPSFFSSALGYTVLTSRARAVAIFDPGPATLFAGNTACGGPGLRVNGTGTVVSGSVHSNGFLGVYASGDSFGDTTYACSQSINGVGNTFRSGPSPTSTRPYPFNYTKSSFACTYSVAGNFNVSNAGPWWQSGAAWGGRLRPGVYCANGGGLQFNGNNVTGEVTFVADGPVQISGTSLNLTAYSRDVFVYTSSTADPAVVIGSSDLTWTGAIFAPNGLVNISGTAFHVRGSIVGKDVIIGATNWTLEGGGGGSGPPHLVE